MTRNEKRMRLGFYSAISEGYIRNSTPVVVLTPSRMHCALLGRLNDIPPFGIVVESNKEEALLDYKGTRNAYRTEDLYPLMRLKTLGNTEANRCLMLLHGAMDKDGNLQSNGELLKMLDEVSHAPLRNALYAYRLCLLFGLVEESDPALDYVLELLPQLWEMDT